MTPKVTLYTTMDKLLLVLLLTNNPMIIIRSNFRSVSVLNILSDVYYFLKNQFY